MENGKQEEGSNVELKRMPHQKQKKTWVGAVEVMNPLHTNIAITQDTRPCKQSDQAVKPAKPSQSRRNSWAELTPTLRNKRKSVLLMGKISNLDQQIYCTITYGQQLVGFFGVLAILFFILNGIESVSADGEDVFYWFAATFGAMTVLCFLMIYYKNFSLAIFLRLCRELNVCVIIVAGIVNLFIEFFSGNIYSFTL